MEITGDKKIKKGQSISTKIKNLIEVISCVCYNSTIEKTKSRYTCFFVG